MFSMATLAGLNAQLTLIVAQLGTVRIESSDTTLKMSKVEAKKLHAWLSEMDTQGVLTAEPVFYPAIKNAIDQDGKSLSETFGTVRVLHSDYSQIHEYNHCSDGSVIISNMHTNSAILLCPNETLKLLSTLQA